MRALTFATAFFLMALAGCSSDGDDAADDTPLGETPEEQVSVPEPLHFEGDVAAGADPSNFVPPPPVGAGQPCSFPQGLSTCYFHDFTISEADVGNGSVSVVATLAWEIPANDLDLYLYQGDTQLSSDGINALGAAEVPPTEQVLRHDGLEAGDYTFWVSVWNGAGDSYTLDAEFQA